MTVVAEDRTSAMETLTGRAWSRLTGLGQPLGRSKEVAFLDALRDARSTTK
jgi:hypothetical protein